MRGGEPIEPQRSGTTVGRDGAGSVAEADAGASGNAPAGASAGTRSLQCQETASIAEKHRKEE